MNDPVEFKHSVDTARAIIETTAHDPDPKRNGLFRVYYREYFEMKLRPRTQRQFVLSFSLDS